MKHRTATLSILILLASVVFICPRLSSSAAGASAEPDPQRRTQQRRRPAARATAQRRPRVDYTKFNHRTPKHQQACDSCHTIPTPNWTRVRAGEEAFPDVADYPDHPSCVNCHRNEFFRGARPVICTVCHTNVSPRDGTRHPFQNPEEGFTKALKKPRTDGTQFAINFPHDRHQDVMARLPQLRGFEMGVAFVPASFARQAPQKRIDSCSICHETYQPQGDSPEAFVVKPPADLPAGSFWLKKGTFKTTPSGHASCFNCHWQEGGERPLSTDCAGCHKLLPAGKTGVFVPRDHVDADVKTAAAMGVTDQAIVNKWLRRDSATFNHGHSKHEPLGCTACHINITAINTLDQKTLKVPILTCGGGGTGCHIKATAPKKILNIEVDKKTADTAFQCAKCHVNFGKVAKEEIPKSHLDAVSTPKK